MGEGQLRKPLPGRRAEDGFFRPHLPHRAELIDKALAAGEERLVILAHGGTQMAAMERFAVPHRDYYAWCGPNAGGFVLDAKDWTEKHLLYLVKTVQYTKESRA